MNKFNIIFYTTPKGKVLFISFLEKQHRKMQAKIIKEIELLEEFGNDVPGNYSKYLGEGVYELRVKFSTNITRIFYFFYRDRNIVIINGFVKKSQKTPRREFEKAKKYKSEYLEREAIPCP